MKKLLCFVLVVLFVFQYVMLSFGDLININKDCSYVLMDLKSGQFLLGNNADVQVRPASTTKIMTAIIALQEGDLNSQMKVSRDAVYDIGPGGMNVGIMAEEEGLTLENMLNVMLIKSANETANIVAENIGGTRANFVQKMNEKAVEIGAVNTKFVNTNGKDDLKEEAFHLTTAHDMAIISRYAMEIPGFRDIVNKEYYNDMPITNKHKTFGILRNTNKLLWPPNNYEYEYETQKKIFTINGIKTGYTNQAGANLISSAVNEDGMELIAVVLNLHDTNNKIFTYSKDLLKYGFENFSSHKIISSNQIFKNVPIEDAKDLNNIDLICANDIASVLSNDTSTWNIITTETIKTPIKAPIQKGDVLGFVELERDGVKIGKTDLLAATSVEINKTKDLKDKVEVVYGSSLFRIIIGIIFALIVCVIVFKKFVKKTSRKKTRLRFRRKQNTACKKSRKYNKKEIEDNRLDY